MMEIEMCLDKALSPIQCPHHGLGSSEDCPKTKPIYYMPINHSHWETAITPAANPDADPDADPEEARHKVETNMVSGLQQVVGEFPEVIVELETTEVELGKLGNAEMKLVADVVEKEMEVWWRGKEMEVEEEEDTKLVFKAHDEENQNMESFDDIWEKFVEEILEG